MSVIGLDLSLGSTGYCVLGEDKFIFASGVIKPKDMSGIIRLEFIANKIQDLIFTTPPRKVGLEGYAFSAHAAYAHELGELGGIVKLLLHRSKIQCDIVGPTKLKKYVTGKGNSKKNEMLLGVYKKWGVSFSDDNAADAYSIARWALEN